MAKAKKAKKPTRRKVKATKGETVEVRTAAIGDNSQLALPAPDDYAHHMKAIRGAKDKLETAKSLLSHAKTAANKTCPGLASSIAETLQIERDGDPVKLQKRFEMLGIGLKQIGSSIQLSVFDTLGGDHLDQVYRRFYADGKAGKTLDNRYPVGSDLAAQAARAWRHGTAANLGQSPEQADSVSELSEVEMALPPPPDMSANGAALH